MGEETLLVQMYLSFVFLLGLPTGWFYLYSFIYFNFFSGREI